MKYHNIDNDLIKNFLIHIDNSDEKIKENLIDWHLALNKGDDDDCANKAKELIKSFVEECFPIIGVTLSEDKQDLFRIYASLENILRIASFLREKERIRDHLNHTIRNILFSAYLMDNVWNIRDVKMRKKLILACAFHDIAYPIEKLKKVAKQIIDSTLGNLINSEGRIDINISEPDKLLELIDFVGNDFEITNIESSSNLLLKKNINTLYRHTIIPAIADKGIFETEHCRSSTVILLRYLLDYSGFGKHVIRNNIENILEICFAISYHDRQRLLNELDTIPDIVKILRVTDELQEWDRDSLEYSYCSDVTITTKNHALLTFKMKDKTKGDNLKCNAYCSIRDKIRGIHGCIENITLKFIFPEDRLIVEESKDEKDEKGLKTKLNEYFSKSKSIIKINEVPFEKGIKYNSVEVLLDLNEVTLKYMNESI